MQAVQQRSGMLLPLGGDPRGALVQGEALPLALAALAQVLLHRVELADPGQGGFHAGRVQPPTFVELASRMRPTRDLDDPPLGFQVNAVVAVESVRLQVTAILLLECGRSRSLATAGEVEHRQRMECVAHVGPQPAGVFLFLPGIADLHRGVVRVKYV